MHSRPVAVAPAPIQDNTKRFYRFYKLVTHEDNFHIHKILGMVALGNFFYRYICYWRYGSMFLDNPQGIYTVGLHGLLSISSLLFHIPNVRNALQPMIYPEFRMHSILFAMRSVVCCFIHYHKLSYMYLILTCMSTFAFADIISWYYRGANKPHDTTMRSMPFPDHFPLHNQEQIKKMHSYFQIGATLFMLCNINTAFSPILAIQLAALLMTLVRKNIITSHMWHSIYSLTLWINYILLPTITPAQFFLIQTLFNIHYFVVFRYRINKYLAWLVQFSLAHWYLQHYETVINRFVLENYQESYNILIKVVVLGIYLLLFFKYRILFMKQ